MTIQKSPEQNVCLECCANKKWDWRSDDKPTTYEVHIVGMIITMCGDCLRKLKELIGESV